MNKSWKDSKGNLHEGKALVSKNGFTVIDCHFCEFKHIIPLTDESIQKEFYSEKFYEEEKQNYIQRQ